MDKKIVEQCNNCGIVERENITLRKMILDLQLKNKVMLDNQENVVQSIAKAAKIKITGKQFILPGEKKYKIGESQDRTKELLFKIGKIMDIVDEKTAVKFQGILDK